MGQNVRVHTIASASHIASSTGLTPSDSSAVMGTGFFSHTFRDVDADDAVAHVHTALAPLGDLVPEHAIELEPSLL